MLKVTHSVSLIVAMANNHVIGHNGALPWHLPQDLQYFKSITWGKPVVMGRRTHLSIGKALPGRDNIILTHDSNFAAPGCHIVHTLDEVWGLTQDAPEIMIIGGAQVYAQTMGLAHRLYLTRIKHAFEGDTFFPNWSESDWRMIEQTDIPQDSSTPYDRSIQILERKR